MSFWKSFFGAMAAAEISEKKRAERERQSAEKKQLNDEIRVLHLEQEFLDYMMSINCRNVSDFDEAISAKHSPEDTWQTKRVIDHYKEKLKEYMRLGGEPAYITEFAKMDLYIEIVRRLKEYGWLDKQDQYVKYADDTYWLDRDWEKEQVKRDWLSELLTLSSNEIKEVTKKDSSDFVPYDVLGEKAVRIQNAYFLPQTRDAGTELFEASISIKLTDEHIVFYDGDTQEEMHYKATVANSTVQVLCSRFTSELTAVDLNGIYVIINANEVGQVQSFYDGHNARVQRENRQAYEGIDTLSGIEFERVCKRLLENMGFTVETTKASGDGGIDLIGYNTQPLLSGKYIIQCKRYAGSVGEPIIRDLYGVVTSERANKGILITTGHFTKSAISFAENKPIELIDGAQLKVLIEQYLKSDSSFVMPAYHSQTSVTSVGREDPEVKTNTSNLPDYLFYSPNNAEFSEIQENPSFVPFGYEDKYHTVVSRMSANPGNLSDTGHMISLLQDYIYNDKSWLWGDVSTNVLYRNKRDALLTVLNVSQNLRTNQYLYLLYLSISAQSHFMLGNWKEAIRYYEELLSQPGVLVDAVHKTVYSGELELAAKIIHNICLILAGAGKEDLAVAYRAKYEYIFDLEQYRTERLINNNPHLKEGFEKAWKQLSDTSSIKDFYFDLTLEWGYGVDGDGMLVAIYKDCENSGEVKKASLDNAKEIQFLHDGSVAIMDYETGDSDSRILVVQLRD